MFDHHSKPKIVCSSFITERWTWTCSVSFDNQIVIFEFVWCSIKWCSTHHYIDCKINVQFVEFPTSRIIIVGMTLKIKINSFEMSLQATIFATLVNCDLLLEKIKYISSCLISSTKCCTQLSKIKIIIAKNCTIKYKSISLQFRIALQ